MKNLNVFINESTNPINEEYPNVLTLGDGEYNGILWGHCFLYENNKYYSEIGWENCFPSYCKMMVENGKTIPCKVDECQRPDLEKLFNK